ncbi:Uridylate kinase [Candidatus Hepatincolaceae symbiont of Richtersius coronifer]
MQYKSVLLKLSGEALFGSHIICSDKLKIFVEEIKSIKDLGLQISIVMGGGNIIRGENSKKLDLTRFKADNMGMLATIINSIALEDYLIKAGLEAVVVSSIEMNKICDFHTVQKSLKYLQSGKIVIFAGGISNPYFSTDTCAVLRAMEVGAEAVFKGTQVDGIYNKDPKKHTDAFLYQHISHKDFINQRLGVMDLSAMLIAEKENLPIIVFNIHIKGNLREIILNKKNQSIIKS